MNKIELMGRMVNEKVELRESKTKVKYVKFTLAVTRKLDKEKTDFIDVIATSKLAEVVEKYVKKGNRIIITGELHIDSFQDKDGNNRKSVSVMMDDLYFVDYNLKKEE